LTRTRVGVIAISSAAVNDVVGWLLLALITTLTISDFVPGRFALRIAMVAAFGLVSALVARLFSSKRSANPGRGTVSCRPTCSAGCWR
jgi:Kef-type K+ transport system membrane component KefB